ncbi:hypothetical protein ACFVVM_25825 [Nocardia sp. NPDC058176]|uniref:hypothetical protein n=1 Tax=Nocardia sp. NPDC058176 TaxID=3346368 RepID=UPI0036DAB4E0
MTTPPRTTGVGPVQRILFLVGALVFGAGALFAAVQPVNALAYLAGLGESVTIEVTGGSVGSFGGNGSHQGTGTIVGDGRTVQLWDVRSGETVEARTVLIDLSLTGAHAYRDGLQASKDFLWVIGLLVLGAPALIFGLAAIAPGRRRNRG